MSKKIGYFSANEDRIIKAKKIESVISGFLGKPLKSMVILDIGTGSGHIAEYLADLGNKVYSIDIADQKTVQNKYKFVLVQDEKLPFRDNFFDIVISSYIIEHTPNQKLHLKEIARVMKPSGICYLSSPNRIFPIEPHTKIPLLHWLPSRFVFRLFGNEPCYLLTYFSLRKMIGKHFTSIREVTAEILKSPKKFHLDVSSSKIAQYFPLWLLKLLCPIMPSNIYLLGKEKQH